VAVMTCSWAPPDNMGSVCGNRAVALLCIVRPCCETFHLAPTCTGHVEAFGGAEAEEEVACQDCGEVARAYSDLDRLLRLD
jgi:hypothetical protein